MALIDNLISYWKLDEASGNAVDAHGSNTLTENGTGGVGTATGIINGARDFESLDSDYFSHSDNSDLSTGDIDFTFQAWLKFESLGATQSMIVKATTDGGSGEYELTFDVGSNRLIFKVFGSSGFANGDTATANNLGAPSTATWYLVHCWHDSVNNQIGIAVNAGTADTTAHSAGVLDSTGEFRLGAYPFYGQYFDGLMDEVGFWKRVLTSAERTSLYNGGAGFAYPFSSGGISRQLKLQYRKVGWADADWRDVGFA